MGLVGGFRHITLREEDFWIGLFLRVSILLCLIRVEK
jgi:hypothetical protein